MDRLDAMALLLAVVDAGSLSAAGRRLALPLATVSRKLSDLEARLGTRLLIRSTRGLSLTDAGRDYVVACRRILDDVDEVERAAAGEYLAPKGELAITAPVVFGRLHVLPVVVEFLRTFPDVDVRLALSDRTVDLADEAFDVALRIGVLPDSGLVATRIATTCERVCSSRAYLDAHGRPERPEDLGAHRCVTFDALSSGGRWRFGDGPSRVFVALRSRLQVNTAEVALDAAIAGLGITRVLSYQAADPIAAGRLVPLLDGFEPRPVPISLVQASRGRVPAKRRAFLDFAVPALRERLGGNR